MLRSACDALVERVSSQMLESSSRLAAPEARHTAAEEVASRITGGKSTEGYYVSIAGRRNV